MPVSLMENSFSIRLARWYIAFAVTVFILLSAIAIALYPGGDDWNPRTVGYEFWLNTLSDLGKGITKSGQVHHGAMLFDAALAILATAFVPLWLAVPRMLSSRPLRRVVTILGLLSVIGMVGVAMTPGDRYPTGHTIAIGMGAVPGLLAFVLLCVGVTAGAKRAAVLPARLYAIWCWLTLAIAMVHFGQHVTTFWLGWTWQPWFPATQKIATIVTLVWLLWTAIRIPTAPRQG